MAAKGWSRLLADAEWCRGAGNFPLPAYSEFMPPPRLGIKPSGEPTVALRDAGDEWGWKINPYEQAHELEPGLARIAREILKEVCNLGHGRPCPQIAKQNLLDNPYWPARLAEHAGKLHHERYVILASVALSKTQDDKGRVRWTLFGASEQGPAKPFWKGFYAAPGQEVDAEQGLSFFCNLLREVYGVAAEPNGLVKAGFRILPSGEDKQFPFWQETIPAWAEPLRWNERGRIKGVNYLLTFRPFERLPEAVQRAYLAGELHLLPFPGSLVFWGSPHYRQLQRQQPLALQVPLLHLFPRYNEPHGMQIPQSGYLDIGKEAAGASPHPLHRPRYVRTHRFQRVGREEDETVALARSDHVTHVLFSTQPDDIGLYGKPMARNAQVWTHDYRLLLDGPSHGRQEIEAANKRVEEGGRFGYRFFFPPMRVGPWELYWHRPIAAFAKPSPESPTLLAAAPTGYLTAYRADRPSLERPLELWPRLARPPMVQEAVELFLHERHPRWYSETLNVRSLLEFHEHLGPLPHSLARRVILAPKEQTLEQWLFSLPNRAADVHRGQRLALGVARLLGADAEQAPADPLAESLTLATTSTRRFETDYWKTIVALAHGEFLNKDNADCFQDEPSEKALRKRSAKHPPQRDLDALGDYLIRQHARAIARAGLAGKAWAGEQAFQWDTDFEFTRFGGWLKNQDGQGYERNIFVRIPGRNRQEAVIMSDHYDTAYMENCYDKSAGGTGARISASGADDNHSATAALLMGAPIFLALSKAGRLKRDIWLVHLTGEEFPSDCMGARALSQAIVERTLRTREPNGKTHDLSRVRVRGLYVADMIAHNNDKAKDIFQIAPGEGPGAAWLALQAHHGNELWNAWAEIGNRQPPRDTAVRGQRSADPQRIPDLARYPKLTGEIRTEWDPRSALYNTDGQIFSDVGIPAVLFMENYDINRQGYHDTHDTMENIDLDYGAALAAIFIETVARAAAEEMQG